MTQIKSIKEEEELVIIDDIEIIQEDEGLCDGSFDTTMSATELCDLGDLIEIEELFFDSQVNDVDLTNTDGYDDTLKEIESTSDEPFLKSSCKLCQLDFGTTSNFYRHLRTKKHIAMEAALYVEPFKIEFQNFASTDTHETQNGLRIIQTSPSQFDNDQEYKIVTETINYENLCSSVGIKYEIIPQPTSVQKKNFKCKFCMKTFSTSSNLRRHTNLHLTNDIYKCAFCPKRFKQREYWKKHSESCRKKRVKAVTMHHFP